jgi:flagellar hook protein FlgE
MNPSFNPCFCSEKSLAHALRVFSHVLASCSPHRGSGARPGKAIRMSIFGAMVTAVTGLNAQSYALENISDNISNSQTTGYKRVDTSFEDMVPDYPVRTQVGGSVLSFSQGTNTISGNVTNSGVGTNFALNGQGFAVVRPSIDSAGGTPTFSAKNLYTRRGDFELDKNGYLVNGAGNYLVGYAADSSGNILGGVPDVMKISTSQVDARATSTLTYAANIPSYPQTTNAKPTTPNSELWGAGTPPAQPAVGGTITPGGTAPVDSATFAASSISGQTVTMYDSLGSQVNVDFRWVKTNSVANGGTDTWNLYYNSAPGTTAATSTWTNVGQFQFDSAGKLSNTPPATATIAVSGQTVGSIALDFTQLTQYADTSGQVKANALVQNGYSAGKLDTVAVSDDGRVMATYSNGQTKAVGQVAIAQFNAANALKRGSGSTFEETLESGTPILNANGTTLISAALAGSNTDIASEFSKMIVTQQAYSANTRVITTAQQMLQDAINIIR